MKISIFFEKNQVFFKYILSISGELTNPINFKSSVLGVVDKTSPLFDISIYLM